MTTKDVREFVKKIIEDDSHIIQYSEADSVEGKSFILHFELLDNKNNYCKEEANVQLFKGRK